MLELNKETYYEIIKEKDKPVLVEFWAPWCVYCRKIAPALKEVEKEYAEQLIMGQVNIDFNPELEEEIGIEVVPTFLLYKDGEVIDHMVAPESKSEIEQFLGIEGIQKKNEDHVHDVVVIGGGPAGYTAAMYCARSGLDTVVLEKLSAGGQMALTSQIDNYPGFEEGIDGFTLGEKMRAGAERFGAKTYLREVTKVELNGEIKRVDAEQETYQTRTVILATGASPRELGVEGEEALTGKGIHYCAACDGMFFKDKTVFVVGGGNTAVADALALSRICQKVILVHRRDTLRATKVYHEALEKAENVEFLWNSAITELLHEERLTGARVKNLVTGEETAIACDGIFVAIGRKPATELFYGQVELTAEGYINAGESTVTSVPGVFAAGDVRQKGVRQVVTAVADGAAASHAIEAYLAELGK